MEVSEESFKNECKALLKGYLDNLIPTEKFRSEFVGLWRRYRTWRYAIKETWPEPHDKQLVAAAIRGEISNEEFNQRFELLVGKATPFHEMLDSIHSALSLYNPNPKQTYEFNDVSLRAEVEKEIREFGLGSLD